MNNLVFLLLFLLAFAIASAKSGEAFVKCAIIQYGWNWGDEAEKDVERLKGFAKEAADSGAKLIVAPENCLYRYDPWERNGVTQLELAQSFSSIVEEFSNFAEDHDVCFVFGTREPSGDDDKSTYQSAVFIDNRGNHLKTYRKRRPSSSESAYTKSGGSDYASFATPFGKVWMQVCKDMDGDGYVDKMPTDIDLFIGINSDPHRGWVKVDAGCAKANCYGIGVNRAPIETTNNAGGNSGFVDPQGNVISEAGTGEKIIYEMLPLLNATRAGIKVRTIPAYAAHRCLRRFSSYSCSFSRSSEKITYAINGRTCTAVPAAFSILINAKPIRSNSSDTGKWK